VIGEDAAGQRAGEPAEAGERHDRRRLVDAEVPFARQVQREEREGEAAEAVDDDADPQDPERSRKPAEHGRQHEGASPV